MKDVNLLISNGVNIQKSLELFGDIETYNDTLGTFLTEVGDKLSKIKNYKENGNMHEYAILVHSLKSDAKYFGFEKLAELAYNHELKSKENDIYYITENYDSLITESNRIVNLVKQYLSGENTSVEATTPAPVQVPSNTSGNAFVNTTPVTQTSAQTPTPNNSRPTILVVDDSEIISGFINKILGSSYNVVIAKDGEEAINYLKSPTNLIGMLLDLNMPKVDGFVVLDFLQQNNLFYSIPVCIITGNDTIETDERAFKYPIVDMLKKPFNELRIKSAIDRILLAKKN